MFLNYKSEAMMETFFIFETFGRYLYVNSAVPFIVPVMADEMM